MSFKVFDLQCEHGHVFEGWFGSHADYDSQHERGLISCPLCGNTTIVRKLSAPRLNVSGLRASSSAPRDAQAENAAPATPASPAMPADVQAELIKQFRNMVRQTENVGDQFADEARRIHHGDAPERAIRGIATPRERQSLAEEGIAVAPIPAMLDDERLQ